MNKLEKRNVTLIIKWEVNESSELRLKEDFDPAWEIGELCDLKMEIASDGYTHTYIHTIYYTHRNTNYKQL